MILSDKTIKEYLANEKIKVIPDCDPRDIRPAGIRLHLGADLLFPVEDQRVDLDAMEDVKFDRIRIADSGYVLRPGQFVLASTLEKFQVARNIVSHVDGRSTVARLGLTIHCTSGIIDGNFDEPRSIVLEMKNEGPFELVMRPKTAVAMLSFTLLSTDIEQAPQTPYRNQVGVGGLNLGERKR